MRTMSASGMGAPFGGITENFSSRVVPLGSRIVKGSPRKARTRFVTVPEPLSIIRTLPVPARRSNSSAMNSA
jgi:hypothetical protein